MVIISKIEFATPEYDEMVKLRTDVLRKPLGMEYAIEELAREYEDDLFAAFDHKMEIVGCLILSQKSDKIMKMRQVAVAFESQKKGIGQQLVAYSEWFAADRGMKKIELHARAPAVSFYEKLSYQIVGEPFLEVNITHLKMEKWLKKI